MFLSLLVLACRLVRFVATPPSLRIAPASLEAALAGIALASLALLLVTRRAPRQHLAQVVSAVLIAIQVPLAVWLTYRWRAGGRPFEAFVDPCVAMCAVGLIVPRSFRLGVAALLALLGASLGAYVWLAAGDTPRALLPSTEPGASVVAAIVGAAVLWARRQRREQTQAWLKLEAEAVVLTRVANAFGAIAGELTEKLGVLVGELTEARRRGIGTELVERASRSARSLEGLRDQLAELSSRPPSPADERDFYARDAHSIARTLACMTLGLSLVLVPLLWRVLPGALLAAWAALGVVAAASLLFLRRSRERPSETRGVLLAFAVTLPWFAIVAFTQPAFALQPQAFEPLIALKMGIVLMPLLVPRRGWISVAVMTLLAAEALALFYFNHFDRLRDRLPAHDPWSTLCFLVVGCALALTREQRRVASLRRLRAEREVAVLERQSSLSLQLLDQTGSPMQVLTLCAGLLVEAHPDDEQLRRVDAAVRAVAKMRDSLFDVDAWRR
jgi:hypothetical protein